MQPIQHNPLQRRVVLLLAVCTALLLLLWLWHRGGTAPPGGAPADAVVPAPAAQLPTASGAAPGAAGPSGAAAAAAADRERRDVAVAGRVVDRAGRAVVGAAVTLNGPGAADRSLRSAEDGAFAAAGLVPGSYQVIVAGSHLLTHSEFVQLAEAAQPTAITLVVDTGLVLAGQLVDQQQRPVAGARITPWRAGPSGTQLDPDCAVVSDAGGRFQLHGAESGITFVHVECAGFAAARGQLRPGRVSVVQLTPAR